MHLRSVCPRNTQYRFWLKLIAKASMVSAAVTLAYFWTTSEIQQSTYIPNKTYKLTILNTNEFNLDTTSDYTVINQGLNHRQELIKKIRREVNAEGGKLLLLSGGELSTDDDILNLKQLNQLGYNAMTVSPLLFDEPINTIRLQEAAADFPFLSANLYESETGRPVFDAYALFDFDGLRIAVMGLTGQGSFSDGISEYRRGIELMDPVLATSELIPYLRRQADIVIVATHAIHYPKPEKSGTKASLPISNLEGIDLLVGNSTLAPNSKIRSSESSTSLTPTPLYPSIRRIDLEFRNGELKKTNSIQINMITKMESKENINF